MATEEDVRRIARSLPETTNGKFFTTPHYDGYPAVLVRFAETDEDELRELLTDSWRLAAPKRVLAAFETDEERRSGAGD